ncbi:hypothetical protein ACFQV2_08295 [Actinokineospora soli]|uniref:Uncharacterized protein n=1 Tax=Actinokineospora soli TaxID=1048753 RepID=A0ABW2TL87_9PSEU
MAETDAQARAAWAEAARDGGALGPAREAYERMQRAWEAELAARAELDRR